MPWTPKSFATKHNHSLGPAQAAHAAKVANAILKKNGGDEGQAIRIANASAEGKSSANPPAHLQKAAGRKLQKGAVNG